MAKEENQLNQMTNIAQPGARHHFTNLKWVLALGIILIPFSLQTGLFGSVWAKTPVGTARTAVTGPVVLSSVLDAPVLSAVLNPNPQGFRGGAEVLVNEGALVSSGPVGEDVIASAKAMTGEISVYTVRAGDTLSHIAEMYGVTANTILWANDLTKATAIREGQTLIILPIVGVQHVVKKGDTLATIAKKYEGRVDEILAYNQLTEEGGLTVGETIVIPGGQIKAVSPAPGTKKGTSGGAWLAHPVPGAVKTQGIHGYNAIDLAASIGTAIRAAGAGEVLVSKSSGWNGGYGQYIVIRHANGAQTLYAHLSRNDVGVGTTVSQGQVIGAMGNSGRSTGSHLHFEVRGASNPF